MAVCGLRTILLIVCVLELIFTIQRQVFDFLGYMWLPIIANFTNILLIIFGSFGAVQFITKYLLAYAIWSFMWLVWNVFLICYYSNLGSLNRESGLLSLGTGSVSWWESNGWGCQPVWGEAGEAWRPARVDGCLLRWHHVELAQSALGALLATTALPLALTVAFKSFKKRKPVADKNTLSRRPAYTIELSPTETTISESSLKPMTPRRVKRRSGSRANNSSVRRSRRSYRNAAYSASSGSLARTSRPASAHSSYSNFHAARPASYHPAEREPEPPPPDSVPILTNRSNSLGRNKAGYDVAGPYRQPAPEPGVAELSARIDDIARGWDCEGEWRAPPPPAPPYSQDALPAPPYSASASPLPQQYEGRGTAGAQYGQAGLQPSSQPQYERHSPSVHAQYGRNSPGSQHLYGRHSPTSQANYGRLPKSSQPPYERHSPNSPAQYERHSPAPYERHSPAQYERHSPSQYERHSPTPQYSVAPHRHESHALYGRPYSGTPISPGPPAYQPTNEIYTNLPPCQH